MSNYITIELCKEDRQRIDEVIGFLGLIVGQKYSTPESALAAFDKNIVQRSAIEHPADAVIPFTTPETFADRLRQAMDNAGVKQADLVRETGLDKGAVSSYLAGKYEPKQKAVAAMAKCLNVPELWLMGYDVPQTEAAPELVGISKKENVEPAAEANYTKADVQALVMKLAAPGTGKKDAVKAIVNEYAKKISDIPEEKLNEVMAKLNQLAEEE